MFKIIPAALAAVAVSSLCHAKTDALYSHLSLAFERNQGQADPTVEFLARGQGYGLFLTPGEAVLTLRAPAAQSSAVVRMQIAGGNLHAQASGVDALPGLSNYYVGKDPARWQTHIPNYAKVRYSGVYPGVDLVYYGNQQQLEYDFVVASGADPSVIALEFKEVDALQVNEAGDLVLRTGSGDLVQHKPIIYQYVDGQRRIIEGNYVVHGLRASFEVGRYDHTRPLVIDPTLAYSTYFGGKDFDNGYSITVDSKGDAYITGFFYLSDFPRALGRGRPETGNGDAFVGKLSPDGMQLEYATVLGGSGEDFGHGIAVDSKGNAYVTGYTRSRDFPTTRGAVQTDLQTGASQNAFVARFDAYGQLEYSTYLGGAASDDGRGIAVDQHDHAYVVGYTSSKNFPTTSQAVQKRLNGLQSAFVTKLNADGTALEYSTLLGGDNYDFGFGIAVNSAGNAYVTGTTYGIFSSTFPVTSNAYQTASSGSGDAFVSKLSADGSALVYSTFLGGTGYDGARGIAVDTSGNAYVTGYTQSTAFPTTAGAAQTALNGPEDAFVTKLNSDGSGLVYSTYLGGSGNDASYGIAVGTNGYAYITGYTQSADFPTTAGAIQTTNSAGGRMPFVAVLNATGAHLSYSTYLGGSNGDSASAIAVDTNNNAYVTGYTNSVDFPVSTNAWQPLLVSSASQDGFVAKISFAVVAQ